MSEPGAFRRPAMELPGVQKGARRGHAEASPPSCATPRSSSLVTIVGYRSTQICCGVPRFSAESDFVGLRRTGHALPAHRSSLSSVDICMPTRMMNCGTVYGKKLGNPGIGLEHPPPPSSYLSLISGECCPLLHICMPSCRATTRFSTSEVARDQ